MPLPVDTTKLTVLCGGPPSPVLDRETGEHRTNREGQALFRTDVVALGLGRPEVFGVRTPKEPKGIAVGTTLNVTALTVSTFTTRDGGTGVFYEATALEAAKGTRETS